MDKSKISVILSEGAGAGVGAKDPRTNLGADPRSSQRSFAPLGPTHPSLRMTQNLQCFFSQVQRRVPVRELDHGLSFGGCAVELFIEACPRSLPFVVTMRDGFREQTETFLQPFGS